MMVTISQRDSLPRGSVAIWLTLRVRLVSSWACEKMPRGTFVMLLCSILRDYVCGVRGGGGERGRRGWVERGERGKGGVMKVVTIAGNMDIGT